MYNEFIAIHMHATAVGEINLLIRVEPMSESMHVEKESQILK